MNELTEQEILNLTDEQIQKMVKLYWAEEGVKMISAPEKPAYHEIPKPDLNRYEISGIDLIFSDLTEAEKTRDFLKGLISLRSWKYTTICCEKIDKDLEKDFNIVSQSFYSEELYNTIEPLTKENKELKSSYEKDLSEYMSEKSRQDKLSNRIWDKVNEVREEYASMERLWNIYKDEYMVLTGDDDKLAMDFLKKAYTVNAKTEHYIEDKLTALYEHTVLL
jgi:hypothetical protein